jgi:hypothetical protein
VKIVARHTKPFAVFVVGAAQETQPIIDVIETHRDEEVSLCAVRVLNIAGQSNVVPNSAS